MRAIKLTIVTVLATAALGTGCTTYPTFGFPAEQGDIEAGRGAFLAHGCNRCHSVAGVSLPEFPGASSPLIELGGETSSIKAYSELVTSIINPNHRISERYREQLTQRTRGPLETQMTTAHIETMTIRQLINLVAFLDSRYVLVGDYFDEL